MLKVLKVNKSYFEVGLNIEVSWRDTRKLRGMEGKPHDEPSSLSMSETGKDGCTID